MTKAIDMLGEYGFYMLNLKRITAPVLSHNQASVRVLEKNAYILEKTINNYFKQKDAFIYVKEKEVV